MRDGRNSPLNVHSDQSPLAAFYNAGIWLFEYGAPPTRTTLRYYWQQPDSGTFCGAAFLGLLGEAKQRRLRRDPLVVRSCCEPRPRAR